MTKFSEIYEKALYRVRDFESLTRTTEMSEQMYSQLLMSAIADVQHYAPISLTFRQEDYVFDQELSLEIKDLLALGVAVKWLEPQFLNSDALKRGMYNKDYRDFGIDADRIAGMYHTLRRMFEGRARTMSFRHSDMDRLTATRRR